MSCFLFVDMGKFLRFFFKFKKVNIFIVLFCVFFCQLLVLMLSSSYLLFILLFHHVFTPLTHGRSPAEHIFPRRAALAKKSRHGGTFSFFPSLLFLYVYFLYPISFLYPVSLYFSFLFHASIIRSTFFCSGSCTFNMIYTYDR